MSAAADDNDDDSSLDSSGRGGTTMACEHLRQLFQHNMTSFCYDNALFYAERLYYEESTEDNLYNIAECYFKQGRNNQTCIILQGAVARRSRYLLAVASLSVGKFAEAEIALLSRPFQQPQSLTEETLKDIPGNAQGLYLLGLICKRQQRRQHAVEYFQMCIKTDATMWCAYTELCELGEFVSTSRVFGFDVPQAVSCLDASSSAAADGSIESESESESGQTPATTASDADSMIERISGRNGSAPRMAASLGPSSLSLHVPFASPGQVPTLIDRSSSPNFSRSGQLNKSYQSSNMSSIYISDLGGTSTSRKSNSSGQSQGHGHSAGISFDSTPSSTRNSSSLHHNHSNSNSNSLLSAIQNSSSNNSRNSVGSAVSQGRPHSDSHQSNSRNNDVSSDESNPNNSISVADDIVDSPSITINTFNSSIYDIPLSNAAPGSQRRVSFGPTAQQTLASQGTKVDNMLNHLDSSGAKDLFDYDEVSDEHPWKLPRNGNTPNFVRESLQISRNSRDAKPGDMLVSPIPISLTPFGGAGGASKAVDKSDGGGGSTNLKIEFDTPYDTPLTAGKFRHQKQFKSSLPREDSDFSNNLDNRVASLLVVFITAYQLLARYQCQDAITLLNRLPEYHLRCGLVQQLLGKAYLEMNNYNASLIAFREMMRLEPFRLTGIDSMSTALWQMKRDKELCSLAQRVVEIDRYSPQTWCVVGNCFSLQRDQDMALKFFKRAIQIEPNFVYAHTLCGHEYVHNEDFDKAILCYRRSLMLNDRHYYAWYGLGSIYMRQEKFDMAEAHFRRALEINPASSVLACYLAMVVHATAQQSSSAGPERSLEALKILHDAIKNDHKNSQCHYELAHISFSLGRNEEALKAIEVARSLAPKEPPIYVLMARIYQRLNNQIESMRYFQMAIDLDPKELGFIKDDLDSLEPPDLGEVLSMALSM